jgi:hypothetical protein
MPQRCSCSSKPRGHWVQGHQPTHAMIHASMGHGQCRFTESKQLYIQNTRFIERKTGLGFLSFSYMQCMILELLVEILSFLFCFVFQIQSQLTGIYCPSQLHC